MAERVAGFKKDRVETPRCYPWHDWADGSIWEIRLGADYDVPTENMRVNLHERAKRYVMLVRTEKVSDETGEGLRFQFERPLLESPTERMLHPVGDRRSHTPRIAHRESPPKSHREQRPIGCAV